MKKLISLISFVLVLVMLTSGATVFGSKAKFKDFNYSPQCGWNGYPDGTFRPNAEITRAEFIFYLYQFYEDLIEKTSIRIEPIRKYNEQFSDVPAKSWYYKSIVWAYERGLINGAGGGKFNPKSTISVFEYAIIMKRFYDVAFSEDYYKYLDEFYREYWKENMITRNSNYSYDYINLRESILENAVLIKMPSWFSKETTLDEILQLDIWIGGGGKQVDMTKFTPTRGELYKHTHDIWETDMPSS